MDRRTVGSAGTALVGVLALALAAATLSSTVERRGGGGDVAGSGPGAGWGLGLPLPHLPLVGPAPELVFLLILLVSLGVVALLLYGPSRAAAAYRDYDLDIDIEFRGGAVRLLVFLVVLGVLALLLAAVLTGPLLPGGSGSDAGPGQAGGQGQTESQTVSVPPLLVGVAVGLVVVTLLAVRFGDRLGSVDLGELTAPDENEDDDEEEEPDPESVARAAGEAADRIEAGRGVENEVYRAWREMTALLSLSAPETRTPGEFADAAVDAGMAPDDVAELTRLFEDVRYGDDDPTPETERRARTVFRRIETTYGDRSS